MAQETFPLNVLVFPFAAIGHITPMLKLAQLLALSNLHVTFLNTESIQHRFFQTDSISTLYPGRFTFNTIPDGLPLDHPRNTIGGYETYEAMKLRSRPIFKDMMIKNPVHCIIADGVLGFVLEVALEVGIPIIQFHTTSPFSFWAYFCLPHVIEAGELHVQDKNSLITKIPGMENFLRHRDIPRYDRKVSLEDDKSLQAVISEVGKFPQAKALILNTFDDLDTTIMSHVTSHCSKMYTLGPLHEHLKTKLKSLGREELDSSILSPNGWWKMDRSCLDWLDNQPMKSVIYVSLGSTTLMTNEQLLELWYGIVNSKQRFLWVARPGSIIGDVGLGDNIPEELVLGTKERGKIVDWAPQEEVLAHKAIGGFLTHSGWNSTLESVVGGVPMICWPYFADQLINSRFVSEVWKLGFDMKDLCDRGVIEKMVKDLMVERKEELWKSTDRMANLAIKSVSQGGSSYNNLERLVEDIRLTCVRAN